MIVAMETVLANQYILGVLRDSHHDELLKSVGFVLRIL